MGRLFIGLVDDFSLWILLYPTTDNNSRLFAAGCCDRSIRFLLPQLRCQHVQHNGHLRQRNLKSHHKGMSIDESWRESSFNYMRYSFVLPLVSTGNLQLRFKLLQPKLRRAATTAGRRSLRHFGFAHDPILNTDMLGKPFFKNNSPPTTPCCFIFPFGILWAGSSLLLSVCHFTFRQHQII